MHGFGIGAIFGAVVFGWPISSCQSGWTEKQALDRACGPCDSVRTCGGWECRAGAEGWQKANNVKGGE